MSDTGCLILDPLQALTCTNWFANALACDTVDCAPSGGGQIFEVRPGTDSQSDFDAIPAQMNSTGGNVVRFLPGNHDGYYHFRGSAHDPGPWPSGVPGNHNCVDGTGANITGINATTAASIDFKGNKYWDAHNLTITGGQFALRLMSAGGDASSPVRISNISASGTRDARIVFQAWFSDQTVPTQYVDASCLTVFGPNGMGNPNPQYSEGVYIGHGSPMDVDRTNNINIDGLHAYNLTSDAVDIKSAAHDITVRNYYIHDIDLNHFDPGGDTPTGAISVWSSNGGAVAGVTPNISIEDGVIHSISGLNATFHHPISIGIDGVSVDTAIIWDHTSSSPIKVRPFSNVYGSTVDLRCITAPEGVLLDLFDPDGTNINVVETCNIDSANVLGTNFAGPTTGTADAGYGPGSGFIPFEGTAPACSGGCNEDLADCPSSPNVAGAWAEAPMGAQ